MLNFIMVLLLIGVFWFLWFRTNNKQRWKKVIFSLLALFVFTMVLANVEAEDSTNLNNEIAKNQELTDTITALEADQSDLQEQFDEIDEATAGLNDKITTLSKENEKLQKDYNSAQEKITQLEKDNDSLQKKLDEKENSKASSAKTESVESNENSEKSTETKSSSESKSTENSSTTTASENPAQDTDACDIKGSKNGIYHVPGSTYYSRTTNVVQWFCSTQEAENAGYRAPKR